MPIKVYFDYTATTPIDPKVLSAMLPYLRKDFGNASSIHQLGQISRAGIDRAREEAADFLGCQPQEIIFTGSATEADNLAIQGIIKKENPHIITSSVEHHAVWELCQVLGKKGLAEVTYLPVDREGIVNASDFKKAIKPNTILASIIYANNEIGTIQPIKEIGSIIKKANSQERKNKIYFHTDAVQAANYLDCKVEKLGVDLLTLSSHKIYGPKGVGLLYVKRGTPVKPLIYGGGQEGGLRSGTENVAGIVGFGAAVAEIQNPRTKIKNIKIRQLRDKLIKGVFKRISDVKLNGSKDLRLPNNINLSFRGAEGEAIVIALDQKGVAASTGSACSAKSLEPSHVLLALGMSDEEAHGSLRLSLGKYTTEEEINKVLKILPSIVERLRKISGIR
ncbi:MAG TPA: cysteine desulfurase family protein [Candidatus Parcubacteria bacterium]|jgi:cysteine desulfurase|nr:cysteine desulfurase NifS [Parcubacteria group bacterium]HJN62094.1 cysteine desulfurase family protein [Candidatus Parcubacteria bacterium]|tara:strand:- start:868 stop:2043 length:1176 start_codon:yes stop_codon:yes gene_type:complete